MWRRDDRGQASSELIGIVAVVALVLVAAGAVAAGGAPRIHNALSGAWQRALCTVAGQRCAVLDREACPVRRIAETSGQRVALGLLRLGHGRELLIERRSDGSYALSLLEDGEAGAGVGIGAELGPAGASADVTATAVGRAGRTYGAASPREARALVARLRDQRLPGVRSVVAGAADLAGLHAADRSVNEYVLAGGAAADALVRLGAGDAFGLGAGGDGGGELGVRIAAHRREVTAYVQVDSRVSAFFDGLTGLSGDLPQRKRPRGTALDARARGDAPPPRERGERDVRAAFDGISGELLDRTRSGTIALRFGAGGRLLAAEVVARAGGSGTDHELRARLDVDDPALAAALRAAARNPADAARLRELGRVAQAGAAIDERAFTVREDGSDVGLEVALGLKLGVAVSDARRVAELLEQRSRPPGGAWEERDDCAA